MTLRELVLLMLLLEKVPRASPKHVRALLCILREKNSYLSLEEIEKNSLIENSELCRILESFSEKKLIEKEGCLFRKLESEKIAEIIS